MIEENQIIWIMHFFIVSFLITCVLPPREHSFIVVVWQKTSGTTLLCIFLPLLFKVFILYNSNLTFSLCFLVSFADPYPIYPLCVFFLSAFPMPCPLYSVKLFLLHKLPVHHLFSYSVCFSLIYKPRDGYCKVTLNS